MSNISEDAISINTDVTNEDGEIVFSSEIDFAVTAQMRLQLAMSEIQKYAALADFDDDADALRKEWGAYYKTIKPLVAADKYEEAFNIALPEQA